MGDVTYLIPANAHGGIAGQALPQSTPPVKLQLSAADFDNTGMFEGGNHRYVVRRPGTYEVNVMVGRGSTVTNTAARLYLYRNGAAVGDSAAYDAAGFTSRHGGMLGCRWRGSCPVNTVFEVYGHTEPGQDGTYGVHGSSFSLDRVGD